MKNFNDIVIEIAKSQIGVKEIGHTNKGKQIQIYQRCTNLEGTGWAWCAAFVCYVVKHSVIKWEKENKQKITFDLPQTAAAYGFDNWSLKQNDSTTTYRRHNNSKVGIFSLKSTSHCGVAISKPDINGWFLTVEGNTNGKGGRDGDGVYSKKRHISDIRDFITINI